MVRRIVGARLSDRATIDDIVQETLVRVLGAADRIDPGMLEPYAIATAKNTVAALFKQRDRHSRNQHRVVDLRAADVPGDDLLAKEQQAAIAKALARLPESDQRVLVAHEVQGQDTRSLAAERSSTAGAIAAQLNRSRARLRVEYLLAYERAQPSTDRCRTVLLALSSGDRRRQREVDAGRHLLECEFCARLSAPLMDRAKDSGDEVRLRIRTDSDIVVARQAVRDIAARLGFTATELTMIATAVSEVARNIVRFASAGEIIIQTLSIPRSGVRVVAVDTGPGIPDVEQVLADGYSTYRGLGMGLPGARRLMDEFALASEVGRGTTVTMTKWSQEGRP